MEKPREQMRSFDGSIYPYVCPILQDIPISYSSHYFLGLICHAWSG